MCPAEPVGFGAWADGGLPWSHYGLNVKLLGLGYGYSTSSGDGQNCLKPCKEVDIFSASKAAVFFDARLQYVMNAKYREFLILHTTGSWKGGRDALRHNGAKSLNCGFLDGHVETLPDPKTYWPSDGYLCRGRRGYEHLQ